MQVQCYLLGEIPLSWAEAIAPMFYFGSPALPMLPPLLLHSSLGILMVYTYHIVLHVALYVSVFPDLPAASGKKCYHFSLHLHCLVSTVPGTLKMLNPC